jgi:glucose uptake protein GlcU
MCDGMDEQINKQIYKLTGVPAILATMVGFLVSGYVISRFKPRAGLVLGWNVIVGCIYIAGEILFLFLACKDNGLYGFQSTRTE